MVLLSLWSSKAKDEIRGISFGDFNNDGNNEVAYASWDGRIYVVKSSNGASVWTFNSKELEGPAEHVEFLEMSNGEKNLIGSIHKYVISLDVENKKMRWYSTLDSWITAIKKADLDEDGEQEIIATTLDGNTFGIDETGEKIWSIEGHRNITPNLINVRDVNFDGVPEVITLGKKSNILRVIGSDGGIIREYKLDGEIKSVSIMRDDDLGINSILAGTQKKLYMINGDDVIGKTIKGGHLPYHISSGDFDNDGSQEIIICDWKSNALEIYEINENLELKKKKTIKVEGNPIFAEVINLKNGDKTNLLISGAKSTTVGEEDSFYIINPKARREKLQWFAAYRGFAYGDILGENGREFILRTGREEITLFSEIPKILAPEYILEKQETVVGFWAPANYNLEASGAIKLGEKTDSSRKKFDEVGFVSRTMYSMRGSKPGSGRIKLSKKGKRAEVYKTVYVISKSSKELDGKTPIKVYKEDRITVKLGDNVEEIMPLMKGFKFNLVENQEKFVLFSSYREGWVDIPLMIKYKGKEKGNTIRFRALIDVPIKLDLKYDRLLAMNDSLTVRLTNKSDAELKVKVYLSEPIESDTVAFALKGKGSTTRKIKIFYEPMNLKDKVKAFLMVEYSGLRQHRLSTSLVLNFVNTEKIEELIKEVSVSAKGEKLLKILAEKLNASTEDVSQLLNKLNIKI